SRDCIVGLGKVMSKDRGGILTAPEPIRRSLNVIGSKNACLCAGGEMADAEHAKSSICCTDEVPLGAAHAAVAVVAHFEPHPSPHGQFLVRAFRRSVLLYTFPP